MDSWVIESVLEQMEIWQSQGLDLKISVNVTSAQLQQEDFVEQIKSALARHSAINPNKLELEVLETVALEDIMSVSNVIEECHRFGVSFALDDFGTGYSSLTYLKRLPISTLKIDSSFVMGMLSDPEDLAIVHSVLSLTHTFQKSVIAEGAETHEHCQMLLQLGCRYAQGFGIAKAMPSDDVLLWVMQWQPLASLKPYQELYWNDTDYPILAAEVEHIHWINGIVSAVNEGLSITPETVSNDHKCRFGKWYYGVGRQQYCDEVTFQNIEQLHQKIHILSGEIAQNCQIGDFERAKKQLPKLLRQRDDVLLRELSLTIAIKFKSAHR
jgi:EAL domain-containing protein (putative c-di-GMP-specific phosphodiesterase class I)